ncbi:hypothetical protein (plasmid) [Metabacillus dongyingensis]|nr:hypothetical protein [Metabacillus dongyingensis]
MHTPLKFYSTNVSSLVEQVNQIVDGNFVLGILQFEMGI